MNKVSLVFFLCLGLSGCNIGPPPGVNNVDWITHILTGAPLPAGDRTIAQASPSSDPDSQRVSQARANAEILHEMFVVITMQEPRNRALFGDWSDTLNQGASIEGVYNGLTHSSDYRKLEETNQGASPAALRIFSEELVNLELELPERTQFDSLSASPLPVLGTVDPSEYEPGNVVIDFTKKPSPKAPDPAALTTQYSKQFVGASIFTLKRVLGDEALKVVSSKDQFLEKVATWYSKWAVRMVQRNVDFGISLRNKPDEAFHYHWAMENKEDRIKWEVLNRLHRVLNEANRQKQ